MSLVCKFVSSEGVASGPQVDIPTSTAPRDLARILQKVLGEDELLPYSFYVGDDEVRTTLGETLASVSAEEVVAITYVPQAVFRVKAVTRCTSTLSGHTDAILHVTFSPDGKMLATGSGDATVRIWDIHTETPKYTLKGHRDWVLCTGWAPNGRHIATGGKEGALFVWDAAEGKAAATLGGHKKWINALSWEPAHRGPASDRLCSASKDAVVKVWNWRTRACLFHLSGHTASVTCVRWGGVGLIYSGSQDRTIKVWVADEGIVARTLEGHGHWVNSLALNTDHALRTGCYDHRGLVQRRGDAGEAKVGDKRKQTGTSAADEAALEMTRHTAQERYDALKGAAGELLASASDDLTVFLWNPSESKKAIVRLQGHQRPVQAIAFSPDGRSLASASFDGSIRLWRVPDGKFLATLRGHVGPVYQVGWSGDSRLVVSGSRDSTMKVWDVSAKKLKQDLPGHADEVFAVDWSPDGARVASGGKDRMLKFWRA